MKAMLFALMAAVTALGASAVHAEDPVGAWAGAIDDHMAVLVHIQKTTSGYTGRFEAHEEPVSQPDPEAFGSVVEAVSATPDHLAFSVPVVGGQFDARWNTEKEAWVGTFRWGQGGYLSQIAMSRTTAVTFADLPPPPSRPDGPADIAKMNEIIQAYVANDQFMGTVLVTKRGEIVFDRAYGYADLEWQTPMTTDAKLRIGSMTKQFTAAAILLLEERGKLKTDDLIKTYLPDAPAAWDRITIQNLLTHTSGLPNYTAQPEFRTVATQTVTPQQIIALFRDKPLEFAPDSNWAYSNSNYFLLGLIIEKVSGETYADFLKANIWAPLHMDDTGYDITATVLPHRARGYALGPQGLANASYADMSTPFSAGAMYSTTHDLLTWENALFGGKVLSAASLKKMTTPYKAGYGYGLFIYAEDGRAAIEHGGNINGFNSEMAHYPDDDVNIIVLDSIEGGTASALHNSLLRLAHGEAVPMPVVREEIHVAHDILQSYVGTYELTPTFSITFTLDGDQLVSEATGQGKLPVYPQSDTLFFAKAVDAQVEFFKDDKGKVAYLVLHQNGHDTKGVRK